jgi:hypothetical protein
MTNTNYASFGILNLGHWRLFEICDLDFVILIIAEPENWSMDILKNLLSLCYAA